MEWITIGLGYLMQLLGKNVVVAYVLPCASEFGSWGHLPRHSQSHTAAGRATTADEIARQESRRRLGLACASTPNIM